MELRILINDCRKQFTSVSRDNLCYLQDGIQYQFPYLVRDGQLESISGGLVEEFPSVSYASNRFTIQRMLYCIMVSEKLAICAEK